MGNNNEKMTPFGALERLSGIYGQVTSRKRLLRQYRSQLKDMDLEKYVSSEEAAYELLTRDERDMTPTLEEHLYTKFSGKLLPCVCQGLIEEPQDSRGRFGKEFEDNDGRSCELVFD